MVVTFVLYIFGASRLFLGFADVVFFALLMLVFILVEFLDFGIVGYLPRKNSVSEVLGFSFACVRPKAARKAKPWD